MNSSVHLSNHHFNKHGLPHRWCRLGLVVVFAMGLFLGQGYQTSDAFQGESVALDDLSEAESVLKSAFYLSEPSRSESEEVLTDDNYGSEIQETKPLILEHSTDLDKPDLEESSPLSDLWNRDYRGIPAAWYLRAVVSLLAVLGLLSLFFRFVFPRLAQKNPQWSQSREEISGKTAPLSEVSGDPTSPLKKANRPPLLWIVLVGLVAIPFRILTQILRWPVQLMAQVMAQKPERSNPLPSASMDSESTPPLSPVSQTDSVNSSSQVLSMPVHPLPLNSLPLTVVQEFSLPQSLRLQLVTVWDRYLVILLAPHSTELMGEVLCDTAVGYVRFEETTGTLSPLVQWVFEYHSAVVQQCVDAVALLSQAALNTPTHEQQPVMDRVGRPLVDKDHAPLSPQQSAMTETRRVFPPEESSSEKQPETVYKVVSSDKPVQSVEDLPDTASLHEASESYPPETPALPSSAKDVYLKYLSVPSSSAVSERPLVMYDPSFLNPADALVDGVAESEFIGQANLKLSLTDSSQTLSSEPSHELSPEPWFVADSPEQFVQSTAIKETLNQMIHEVLASEGMVRQDEFSPSEAQLKSAESFASEASETFDESSPVLNLASSETVIDSDTPPEFLTHPAPVEPLLDELKPEPVPTKAPMISNSEEVSHQNLSVRQNVSAHQNLSDRVPHPEGAEPHLSDKHPESKKRDEPEDVEVSFASESSFAEEQMRSEPTASEITRAEPNEPETIVLGEIDLEAHLLETHLLEVNLKEPPSAPPNPSVPSLSLPPLSDRLAIASAASLNDEPPDTFSEALERPAFIAPEQPSSEITDRSDTYPLSGLSRQKSKELSDPKNKESLQTLLFPEEPLEPTLSGSRPSSSRPSSLSERRHKEAPEQQVPQQKQFAPADPSVMGSPIPDEIVVMDDYDDTF